MTTYGPIGEPNTHPDSWFTADAWVYPIPFTVETARRVTMPVLPPNPIPAIVLDINIVKRADLIWTGQPMLTNNPPAWEWVTAVWSQVYADNTYQADGVTQVRPAGLVHDLPAGDYVAFLSVFGMASVEADQAGIAGTYLEMGDIYDALTAAVRGEPTTVGQVKGFLKITDANDDAELGDIVAAVNAIVRGLPVAARVQGTDTPWPAPVVRGATMLAGRLFRRRATPSGVEAFGVDGVVYVSRNDPDIAMLLEMGAYARPGVG